MQINTQRRKCRALPLSHNAQHKDVSQSGGQKIHADQKTSNISGMSGLRISASHAAWCMSAVMGAQAKRELP
jgi:hypothetical protein